MSGIVRVSDTASLAIHVMVRLGVAQNERLPASEIASQLRVPSTRLTKVLRRLMRRKLVKSICGARGGFYLSRKGKTATLLDIYECIEGPIEKNGCLFEEPLCNGSGCILSGLLKSITEQTKNYLSTTTLLQLSRIYKNRR
jgi:Rrf2 family protein